MDGTKASAANRSEDDLVESWFEQGELGAVSEAAPYHEERTGRRSRIGVVVAAISATALTLVIVFGGHI